MLPNVAETGIFCNYDPAIHVAILFSNHIVLSVQLFYSMRDFIVIYLLESLNHLPPGETLSIIFQRDPIVLYVKERLYRHISLGKTLSSYTSRGDFIIIYL